MRGDLSALLEVKRPEKEKLHDEFLLAFNRLREGSPIRVPSGTPISVSAVANEANRDRTSLYKDHREVLNLIKEHNLKSKAISLSKMAETVSILKHRYKGAFAAKKQLLEDKDNQARIINRLHIQIEDLQQELCRLRKDKTAVLSRRPHQK